MKEKLWPWKEIEAIEFFYYAKKGMLEMQKKKLELVKSWLAEFVKDLRGPYVDSNIRS